MTPLADKLPTMTDPDLVTLHANATRLVETGSVSQVTAADEILPLINAEVARRAALSSTAAPRKRAPAKKKVPPVTGHQTALPAR
ncbi:MAG: hypothetical protein EON87_16425 [Brevundimonas sp.]|nr:MAG: hypothetical protein EON87_16425 [Brevundimonas sp.]